MKRLLLLSLFGCAHNAPSTKAPDFYQCWSTGPADKICIANIYDCHLNSPKVGQYKWLCEKVH